jgi:hypothetical protein
MMSLINKAKELSAQAVEKAGDLAGDDLMVNAILRAIKKQDRVNELLKEKGSDYRISDIQVENNIPQKISFSVARELEKP